MKIRNYFCLLTAFLTILSSQVKADDITEQEAHEIGISAYLYFYPLITMDLTRKQMTNSQPGEIPGYGPMNTFANVPEYPTADMKTVVLQPGEAKTSVHISSIGRR